ncbi:MAG: winged helix-turn-helix domain-containing protein, partial [Roseiarcus sp.]
MAARPKDPIFAFGRFQLFPSRRLLEENGKPVQLASRAFDLLLALVERRGSIVSKPELLQLVWPDTNVEEGSLRVSMAAVRKVLGENRSERNYIRNVP